MPPLPRVQLAKSWKTDVLQLMCYMPFTTVRGEPSQMHVKLFYQTSCLDMKDDGLHMLWLSENSVLRLDALDDEGVIASSFPHHLIIY